MEIKRCHEVSADGDALVVGDDLLPDGLDRLGVRLDPANLN